MAHPAISVRVLRQTVAAVRRCGGNRAYAASRLGIARTTLNSRLEGARVAGMDVPAPSTVPVAGGSASTISVVRELERERKRVASLTAQLEAARHARTKRRAPPPAAKRIGKDDTVRVVFPDLHGCYMDRSAVAAFLGDVKRLDPDSVIGLGDIFDAGGFLAQHHTFGYVAETAYTFEEDIAAANGFLDGVQAAAPRARVELIEGNHEQRIERWCVTSALRNNRDSAFLLSAYAPDVLLGLKKRGIGWFRRATYHDGLPVQGAIRRGKVCYAHGLIGQRDSSNPCATMLSKFQTNVVFGHTHKVGSVVTNTVSAGTLGAWNLGCLSLRQPLWQHGNPTGWATAYGLEFIARSGRFLHLTVPIVGGVSLLPDMRTR